MPLHTTDEDWHLVFADLAHSSRAIFLIPGDTPGLANEIEALTGSGFINKTLVFMPPDAEYMSSFSKNRDRKPEWERIQQFWRKRGKRLPDYSPEGMIYLPSGDNVG